MKQKGSSIIEVIKSKISISSKEEEVLSTYFQSVGKTKNEYLVTTGAKSQNLYFIVSGYVRIFYLDEMGNEITTELYTSNDLVTSFESFLHNDYSKISIQCISDCALLSISKKEYDDLYNKVAEWPVFCQGVYERQILKMTERVNALQNLSASARYEDLLKKQPGIALHASVKHLASYLGIKPQSLSRIRKGIK